MAAYDTRGISSWLDIVQNRKKEQEKYDMYPQKCGLDISRVAPGYVLRVMCDKALNEALPTTL